MLASFRTGGRRLSGVGLQASPGAGVRSRFNVVLPRSIVTLQATRMQHAWHYRKPCSVSSLTRASNNQHSLPVIHVLQIRYSSSSFADPDPDSNDPYQILGVSRGATEADLKRAYLRAAKAYHPDMNPGDKAAQQRFQKVAQAYDTLRDPQRRAAFDASGNWTGSGASGGAAPNAEEMFRNAARDREVIMELVKMYLETVREEARLAVDYAQQGRWSEAWSLAREHQGLMVGAAAVLVVFRFPAAVGLALRLVAACLLHPAVFRPVMRAGLDMRLWAWAWQRLITAAHRQRARLKQRAADREVMATRMQQEKQREAAADGSRGDSSVRKTSGARRRGG